ncbi:MAG: helix-turn-helix domain-containing protein [Thermomicrobiales bacterium]
MVAAIREILTPEQAADYLQVNRETIYRYIRDGKLAASRLGRGYRITKRSLDLLLLTNRTRPDISPREYSDRQLADFLQTDRLDAETQSLIVSLQASADSSHA